MAAAFGVIQAFGWRFGLDATASETAVATLQVIVAGLAAAARFRSSLFTTRVGNQDVGVGPSALLDTLLNAVDRAVDRRRAVERLATARGHCGHGQDADVRARCADADRRGWTSRRACN
ncbi:hypothetical protein OM076_09060 [Solirubrobacter ginsenosidimutans]|uniref:Uncharacterized protein n=1 Tax=Solirubrobacter ginsenosidimutans TaxID=490573 RepID=A0A9X3MSI0_9ACTN|nr:hypothetical protein [Solirubrobacter ginsenosidimutans]MDA0160413.1 hypothetical protein [Solirubrobacter ginsenosidimutans]